MYSFGVYLPEFTVIAICVNHISRSHVKVELDSVQNDFLTLTDDFKTKPPVDLRFHLVPGGCCRSK